MLGLSLALSTWRRLVGTLGLSVDSTAVTADSEFVTADTN